MSAADRVYPPSPTLDAVTAFLTRECRLLDERRFDEWRDLFTEDGAYWVPTRHDQTSPEEAVSLFYDDRVTMAARIRRLNHPDVHVQVPASRTVHLISNIEAEAIPGEPAGVRAYAALVMAEYRHTEPRWYAGRCDYRLRRSDDGFRIALKKVTLVNCNAPFTSIGVYF